MDEELLSLLSVPLEVVLGFGVVMLLLLLVARIVSRIRRNRRRRLKAEERAAMVMAMPKDTPDEDVMPPINAYPMPVIGLIEERVFDELEDIASQSIMGHRVLTQLSLSAFLYAGSSGLSRADERRVVSHLAGLQVDFLIVDADWRPVVAVNIERDASAADEALEEEADICARAGVAYLIVNADGLSPERQDEIRRLLENRAGIAAQ